MPKINTYKDLLIWQKAHAMAKEVLDLCENLNHGQTARMIAEQLVRSATSIPANIAEGYGGRIGKEYVSYLFNARKSLTETDYWILLAHERNLIEEQKAKRLQNGYNELIKMLNALMRTLSSGGKE